MASETISYHEAILIARTEINKTSNHDFIVDEAQTQKKIFGWVFFYNTKQFIETRNPRYAVPGNGPLIVNFDGSTKFLSTNRPSSVNIEEYEKEFLKKSPN